MSQGLAKTMRERLAVGRKLLQPNNQLEIDAAEAIQMCRSYEKLAVGGFWKTDRDGNLTYLSPQLVETFALSDGVNNVGFIDIFSSDCEESVGGRTLSFVTSRKRRFVQFTATRFEFGQKSIWSVSGDQIYDGKGDFSGYCGYMYDVTSDQLMVESAEKTASTDSLTGLLNRRGMNSALERIVGAQTAGTKTNSIFLIDLDRFKHVNDTLGHGVGDELLQQVAARLLEIIGQGSIISRLGGDEFQILIPGIDDRGILGSQAQHIVQTLSQPFAIKGHRCTIGASIGIAVSPDDGTTAADLTRNADLALYAAKQSGRGTFRFFSHTMLKLAEERRHLEETMRDALANGEFEVYYQPLVKVSDNSVMGVEALLRWNHPTLGLVSPAKFIPIAEESNMICPIGEWVLKQACSDAKTWNGAMRVAVNVSPIQFSDPNFIKSVALALASTGLEPNRLELEITESVFLQDSESTAEIFKRLKGLGVRLALDDFGTGYSSLSYIQNAPFDKIKIDQSFVRGATSDTNRNRAIIGAIVTLANTLNMETIAEGIESFDQLQMLKDLGIEHAQGYLFSKPLSFKNFIHECDSNDWVIVPSGPAHQRPERRSMLRSIGLIHDDHYYPVTLRNISETGALIEGLIDVPLETVFVIDLGDGQFELAIVKRSKGAQQGVEFNRSLVSDGAGGLCTRYRLAPYKLVSSGLPTNSKEFIDRQDAMIRTGQLTLPKFALEKHQRS